MILVCKHLISNIYLFGVLHRFQNCTGHIKMASGQRKPVDTVAQGKTADHQ